MSRRIESVRALSYVMDGLAFGFHEKRANDAFRIQAIFDGPIIGNCGFQETVRQ